jgi:hypothetical protein
MAIEDLLDLAQVAFLAFSLDLCLDNLQKAPLADEHVQVTLGLLEQLSDYTPELVRHVLGAHLTRMLIHPGGKPIM